MKAINALLAVMFLTRILVLSATQAMFDELVSDEEQLITFEEAITTAASNESSTLA
jgi:hypothetical protein